MSSFCIKLDQILFAMARSETLRLIPKGTLNAPIVLVVIDIYGLFNIGIAISVEQASHSNYFHSMVYVV
jgi:hypothetical protein